MFRIEEFLESLFDNASINLIKFLFFKKLDSSLA